MRPLPFPEKQGAKALCFNKKMTEGVIAIKLERISEKTFKCTIPFTELDSMKITPMDLVLMNGKVQKLISDIAAEIIERYDFVSMESFALEIHVSAGNALILMITKCDSKQELEMVAHGRKPLMSENINICRKPVEKLEGSKEVHEDEEEPAEECEDDCDDEYEDEYEDDDIDEEADYCFDNIRLFIFNKMDEVIRASRMIANMFAGESELCKSGDDNYVLIIAQENVPDADFYKVCNMLSEYGEIRKTSGSLLAYIGEHCEILIPNMALQMLAAI